MKVKVQYTVEYETDDFYDEIEEYAGDHLITLNINKLKLINRHSTRITTMHRTQ